MLCAHQHHVRWTGARRSNLRTLLIILGRFPKFRSLSVLHYFILPRVLQSIVFPVSSLFVCPWDPSLVWDGAQLNHTNSFSRATTTHSASTWEHRRDSDFLCAPFLSTGTYYLAFIVNNSDSVQCVVSWYISHQFCSRSVRVAHYACVYIHCDSRQAGLAGFFRLRNAGCDVHGAKCMWHHSAPCFHIYARYVEA